MMFDHIVQVQIGKSRKLLESNVYKIHHEEKFATKEAADRWVTQFNAICDRNRRAVYIEVKE